MTQSNKKKSKQLGMAHGTAANRLRKMLMFQLMVETGKDKCFQCGEVIKNVSDLSIEHKVPWLDSENPVGLFFDLDNIAFSHLSCNCKASRGSRKYYTGEQKEARRNEYNRRKRDARKAWTPEQIDQEKSRRAERYIRTGN